MKIEDLRLKNLKTRRKNHWQKKVLVILNTGSGVKDQGVGWQKQRVDLEGDELRSKESAGVRLVVEECYC